MADTDRRRAHSTLPPDGPHPPPGLRPVDARGDAYGSHRSVTPAGSLPQSAWRLDNDFSRLFAGEALLAVETLNLDAASFAQIEAQAHPQACPDPGAIGEAVAHIVLRTVAERGKQHNPVTGSGGMLVGRVLQVAPGREDGLQAGDDLATLVSLTLTPLRLDRVRAVRLGSAQIDVEGEAVLFSSGPYAVLPDDLPKRLVLAVLDVAGAAPQVARLVEAGDTVVILGAGGKSGILCAAEARRASGPSGRVVGVEASPRAAEELRALDLCDSVIVADARDPLAVRRLVLEETAGNEANVTLSCVNVPDAEMAAIVVTRHRGTAYFFAMSTSFTRAALGAEGVGKDIDLVMGNGYARGHAHHTLGLLRAVPGVRALFERRYA
jgi:L-erythro-3,5-diaminohexanoate dehydrogenase